MLYFFLIILFLPLLAGAGACIISGIILKKAKTSLKKIPPPALLFHSITDAFSFDQSHITCSTFDSVLNVFNQKGYTTSTVSEILSLHPANKPQTDTRSLLLVFDDGFENFYVNAFPILTKYSMRATVFPIVGCTQVTVAWDVYAPKKHLSKEQLKIISNAGHEIGSHTMTHPDCVLLSAEKLRDELIDSKKILEDIIQKPVQSISFPSGSWNARVWDCARECGYITGVVYRKHSRTLDSMIPAIGVYAFDSVEDIIEKVGKKKQYSHACARSIIMPHFAKGTSVWKYRSEYRILNIFS